VPAVTGFVGRNQAKSMDQNLIDFEESFVPLLKEAKARNLQYRVEQCPMPGWTPGDNFHNNIAYAPGMWIALHQIAERNGVGDQFRIHYDPSHAILMGQDTRSIFQYLKDTGYGFLIAGFRHPGLPPYTVGYIYLPALVAIVSASVLIAPIGVRLAHRWPVARLRHSFAALMYLVAAFFFWKLIYG